jgi:hypothetical protein
MNKLLIWSLSLGLLLSYPAITLAQDNAPWRMLFDGKSLDGWKRLGGEAPYTIEDGAIVGTTVNNTPNTFLTTEEYFSDFILEYEVWVNPRFNSGVQIRSNSLPDYRDGRVHGYQVEIDPSSRMWSGGIYDEARRGWLYPLSVNAKAEKALQAGHWNTFHVEALGDTILVWLNGIQTAYLVDDMTARGFIGLQVHSIRGDMQPGEQVKWRNLRIITDNPAAHRWQSDPDVRQLSYLNNTLTPQEKRLGWRLLWDGKTTNGWRGAKLKDFPAQGWTINDGVLTVEASDGAESANGGDIVTRDEFSDFELELEFMITEGANSGIKYFVDPALNKGEGSAIGLEFQILDDKEHPDAKMGKNGNRTVGSLYDLIRAENVRYPDRGKQFRGVGNWNRARLVVKDGQVEHWLNNELVVEFDRHSQIFKALVEKSKYEQWENFGRWPQGPILLQDHGDKVSFRNIKIREL